MTLDDPAVRDILERSLVGLVATRSRRGRPHVNPLWFVHHGGRVYFNTSERTLAGLNAAADPHAVVLFNVEQDPEPTQVLRIHGRTRFVTEPRVTRPLRRRLIRRYVLRPRPLRNWLSHPRQLRWMPNYAAQGKPRFGRAGFIEVVPERVEILDLRLLND